MNTSVILKVTGIVLICVAIKFGLEWSVLPLIVLGAGIGFLFLG